MQKIKTLLVTAGIIILAGAGCSGQSTNSTATTQPQGTTTSIQIGWVGPLTGDVAGPGNDALNAAKLAVSEVNAAGGVNGQPIALDVQDTKCDPKEAANAGNKLINVDKVPVIIGGACSGETSAIAPTAEANKTVLISYCSSAPNITTAGDYVFRTYPSDVFQGSFAADYVYNTLGKRKIATLAALTDYSTGIKNAFETSFKALGGQIVSSQDFAQDSRDLRSQLTKIKSSGADMIYFVAYTETYLTGYKEAKELGITLPIFSADSMDDTKVQSSGLADGVMYTLPSTNYDAGWKSKMATAGYNVSTCAPRSYDNVKLIASVMSQVGTDPTKIKDALYQVKDFPGAAGLINFDKNGDPTVSAYDVKVVKDGKAELVK